MRGRQLKGASTSWKLGSSYKTPRIWGLPSGYSRGFLPGILVSPFSVPKFGGKMKKKIDKFGFFCGNSTSPKKKKKSQREIFPPLPGIILLDYLGAGILVKIIKKKKFCRNYYKLTVNSNKSHFSF